MATYLIKNEKIITRQEGDDADIVFTVPASLSISGGEIVFSVFRNGTAFITKEETDMTIEGQQITIPILPEDTTGKPGQHRWELQLTTGGKIITIGRGNFTIIQELIK